MIDVSNQSTSRLSIEYVIVYSDSQAKNEWLRGKNPL